MSQFRFFSPHSQVAERRFADRRETLAGDERPPFWTPTKKRFMLAVIVLLSGLLLWEWKYVVNAPIWLARATHRDRSDIYKGKTNGFSNRELVLQARAYLTQINQLDASGNITSPESMRPLGVTIDVKWFQHHAPDSVDFNPFDASGGSYIISWRYVPGCQKAVWKPAKSTTDWYDLKGQPCYGLCWVSIVMTSDHRLNAVKIRPLLNG